MSVPTRARILDAAWDLFLRQGFAGTTVTQIEAAAALLAGSGRFYRHFRSKEEVLQAVVDREVDRINAERQIGPEPEESAAKTGIEHHDRVGCPSGLNECAHGAEFNTVVPNVPSIGRRQGSRLGCGPLIRGGRCMTRLRAVFFDVGETILDETREWGTWADCLGVPRHTFSAVFGAVLARGGDFRETFQHFRPGFDLAAERQGRIDAGLPEAITEESLYPDARPCLAALREQGLLIGLAGNQPARVEAILHRLDFPVDVVGTSDGWGVEKPLPEFFDRVVAEAGCPAEAVLYVGDRLDNDIRPAQAAGMPTALIRRGPWAYILEDSDATERCLFRIDSLEELPALVAAHNAGE